MPIVIIFASHPNELNQSVIDFIISILILFRYIKFCIKVTYKGNIINAKLSLPQNSISSQESPRHVILLNPVRSAYKTVCRSFAR